MSLGSHLNDYILAKSSNEKHFLFLSQKSKKNQCIEAENALRGYMNFPGAVDL